MTRSELMYLAALVTLAPFLNIAIALPVAAALILRGVWLDWRELTGTRRSPISFRGAVWIGATLLCMAVWAFIAWLAGWL